jgi:GcrA cell cycle regulator
MMRVARPAMRGNTALAQQFDYEPELEVAPVENVIPMGQRRTILELTEDTCRWPIGDPGSTEFFFCGGHTAPTAPYCSFHSRVAYQPVNDRRRPKVQFRS